MEVKHRKVQTDCEKIECSICLNSWNQAVEGKAT